MRRSLHSEGHGKSVWAGRSQERTIPTRFDILAWMSGNERGDDAVATWPGSAFPGLWVDQADAEAQLEARIADGRIGEEERHLFRNFIDCGFAVLEGAVNPEVCDKVHERLSQGWLHGDESLLIQDPGSQVHQPLRSDLRPDRMRVVDMHAVSDPARQALFASPIVRFLTALFDDDILLFQSLTFERGSEQGLHQDPAYVVVSSPRELAATWIALEDIRPGSGELNYLVGSHRIPEYLFSGKFKHYNPQRDGSDQHQEWCEMLLRHAEDLELQTFLPKKGDALVWHADLAHGGSKVVDPSLTRRSLVGHYCPRRISPYYFEHAPHRQTTVATDAGWYSSFHVNLDQQLI